MELIIDEILRAIAYLFYAGIFSWILNSARDQAKTSGLKTVLFKGLLWCSVIALFASSSLGSHTENCDDDPYRGSCDRVQDYTPTNTEYVANFLFFFTLFYTQVIIGA